MQKDKQESQNGLPEIGLSLDELMRRGARQVIQQAIEAELVELLAQYVNGGCGQKLGLLGGSSCTHMKTAFGR
jgi:hypothetical protein